MLDRRLIVRRRVLERLIAGLTPENHSVAVELAKLPQTIKGFGYVKERHVETARKMEAALIEKFYNPSLLKVAAE